MNRVSNQRESMVEGISGHAGGWHWGQEVGGRAKGPAQAEGLGVSSHSSGALQPLLPHKGLIPQGARSIPQVLSFLTLTSKRKKRRRRRRVYLGQQPQGRKAPSQTDTWLWLQSTGLSTMCSFHLHSGKSPLVFRFTCPHLSVFWRLDEVSYLNDYISIKIIYTLERKVCIL